MYPLCGDRRVRAIVCGGRKYNNVDFVHRTLDGFPLTEIAEGGATGADFIAKEWAKLRNIPCRSFPADWRKYGLGAGHKRNQRMLEEFNPDILVAFAGNVGTADMVRRARKASIPIIQEIQPKEGSLNL